MSKSSPADGDYDSELTLRDLRGEAIRTRTQARITGGAVSIAVPPHVGSYPGYYDAELRIDGDVANGFFFDPADATLNELLNGKGQFDAALGIYGTFREYTFGGITFNNLVSSRLSQIAGTGEAESFFSYYTFNLGHQFELTQQKVTLEPSLLMRQIRNAPFQMDLNLKAGFLDEQLIAGLSYRAGLGAMGILLGTRLTNFRLYYSYDVSFQRFQSYNTGSHEVTIALEFKKRDKKKNPNQ